MPELPEVETVCRIMRDVLVGKTIAEAEFVEDDIVHSGLEAAYLEGLMAGRVVTGVGRKGKYWWIETDERPWMFGHLGMAGWIREIGASTIRLKEHGQAPLDDETGRPRFLKWRLQAEDGRQVVMTDSRRFARVWTGDDPSNDPRLVKLGPDVYSDPPVVSELAEKLKRRKAPIKAVLLDQKLFAGVGNWIADEVLFHARVAPKRLGSSLSRAEVEALLGALKTVLDHSVEVGADYEQFPDDWMFHVRWGGSKGEDVIGGNQIVREQVGGRTTAWVPAVQK